MGGYKFLKTNIFFLLGFYGYFSYFGNFIEKCMEKNVDESMHIQKSQEISYGKNWLVVKLEFLKVW